jgi:hypothetical protein
MTEHSQLTLPTNRKINNMKSSQQSNSYKLLLRIMSTGERGTGEKKRVSAQRCWFDQDSDYKEEKQNFIELKSSPVRNNVTVGEE